MIWMAVSADEYELPFAVADSAKNLAEMIGSTEQKVREKCCKDRKRPAHRDNRGARLTYKIVRVEE